ncbi:DNA translocase FtsK [Aurantimonas sp. 22II-16-19i]|uniref:FtsK/SpoIIIE family DNA translocase n=1 Tax=Aurantimonas sp. 22II-16-19i TaxID=1317114 RepID=UPI0009F8003B|nr:DNA translocase FtsK [Aurantimonas sp. 22II-16-19i]ORE97492.1 DNA translocase FtsK [Aurantimonas sp. 22II-16-19i]
MAYLAVGEQQNSLFRRGIEVAGAGLLLCLAAYLCLACATWSVTDPSLSQSNQNMIENAAGATGAIVADLMMQIFGIGAALVIGLPVIWALRLISGRSVDHIWKRGWFAVGGVVLACAALSCLDAPQSWPLPIGIGGVAGDLLLKIPAGLFGGYPSGIWALPLAALLAAPAGWLYLNGAAVIGRYASKAEKRALDEDDGEGRLSLLIGAAAHMLFSARAAWQRRSEQRRTVREPEFGERFDHWRDEDDIVFAPPQPALVEPAGRSIKVSMPANDGQSFVDPTDWQDEDEDDDSVAAWAADDTAGWQDEDRGNAFGQDRGQDSARDRGQNWDSHDFGGDAFEAEIRAAAAAPAAMSAAGTDDAMSMTADDRVAGRGEEREGEGGWRGLLSGNIVAFPGRKASQQKQRTDPAPAATSGREAAAASRPAPTSPAPHSPTQPAPAPTMPARDGAGDAPVRVVAQRTVTADQQRLRTGSGRAVAMKPQSMTVADPASFELPLIDFLSPPKATGRDSSMSPEALQENARLLEGVLEDFGVKGEIIEVRPGPVVTLYELEPAPGIKSSRVIGLADDIARSMSAIAARVAVIPGKNAIGIELPNQRRETVYFREMIGSEAFTNSKSKLALALGKTIGGEAVIADLAKMPHLLVAGTTGSGKSVSINTMILSLLYRMTPAECRMIMIDPKMLELSIYDGIPHLLSPVVTDPKKAVVALKWTVREMEDRYRKMSKVGVRNIDGFNSRVRQAMDRGETMSRTVQTGFDRETGEPIFETEQFDLEPLPYIVVIIDEMADLMMVAGKEIEGTVQRLAQMARAAGIHVIMATQRPSVDVITGTIKANFPTRISFQVTSKIDSRTILQEQGAEQLLGMGDMLFMAGGGRIQRVHGPFVDDPEVEAIVAHLKAQGVPDYLDSILEDEDEDGGSSGGGSSSGGGGSAGGDDSDDPYDQAVAVVLRDGKASTSYIQRRLGIGYNRAASIIEKMEKEGIVGPANHAGKREILVPTEDEI